MTLLPELFPGVMVGQTSGLPVGPVEDMTYTVLVNFHGGAREVGGIAPAVDRWDGLDCRAIKPGTAVVVGSVLGRLQLLTSELPDRRTCQPPGPDQGESILQAILRMTRTQKAAIRAALEIS